VSDGRRGNHANLKGRGRPYKPGESGNVGGYTRAQAALRKLQHELIGAATDGGQEIIDFVLAVFRGENGACDDAKSRRWAADFLADRLWGRAPMTVTVKPAGRLEVDDMRKLPLEELQRLAAGAEPVIDVEAREPDEPPPGDVH
jgi:hypothetical protein